MFEHLLNCHGEWNALIAMVGSIPFLGIWIRSKLYREGDENESR